MGSPRTSLWLVPAEPHRTVLRGHIDQLADRFDTPSFEPHVTLVSGELDDDDALARAVGHVAAAWAPLELAAGPTGNGPDRFKAVFVELGDARIHRLAGELAAALGPDFDPSELSPHLSLLYVEGLGAAVRAAVAASHRFSGERWRFDTLVAIRPGEDPDDVSGWRTVAVRPLGGR